MTITLYFFAAIVAALAVGCVCGRERGYDEGYADCMSDSLEIIRGKAYGLTDEAILGRLERIDRMEK